MNLGQFQAGFMASVICYSMTPHDFANDVSYQLPICLNLISVNMTGEQKKKKKKSSWEILSETDTSSSLEISFSFLTQSLFLLEIPMPCSYRRPAYFANCSLPHAPQKMIL